MVLIVSVTDMLDRDQVKALLSNGVDCVSHRHVRQELRKALLSNGVDCVCDRHVGKGTGEGLAV